MKKTIHILTTVAIIIELSGRGAGTWNTECGGWDKNTMSSEYSRTRGVVNKRGRGKARGGVVNRRGWRRERLSPLFPQGKSAGTGVGVSARIYDSNSLGDRVREGPGSKCRHAVTVQGISARIHVANSHGDRQWRKQLLRMFGPELIRINSGWTWTPWKRKPRVLRFETWWSIVQPFFWNGTKNMPRFVFRTCFGMIISVRARGHCESSRRSARR